MLEAARVAVVAAVLLLALSVPATAQVDIEGRHGAGLLHRAEGFIPVRVTLENLSDEDWTVRLEGYWGEEDAPQAQRRVELAAGGKKEVDFYLGPVGFASNYVIQAVPEGGDNPEEVNFTSVVVDPRRAVVGILSGHPMGWPELLDRGALDGKTAFLKTQDLPGLGLGLGVFNVIVWPEPRLDLLRNDQVRALQQWVETGGHLLLGLGDTGSRAWEPWTQTQVRDLRAADTLAGLEKVIAGNAPPRFAEAVAAASLEPGPQGRAWINGADGVLAVMEKRGRGTVTVLGFNPSAPQIAGWDELTKVWAAYLAELRIEPPATLQDRRQPLSLTGIAHRFLTSDWGGGEPLSPRILALLLGIYLLIIGPGEYLVLRHFDRLRWTWVTFPIWVVLFSSVAYGTAALSRGDASKARHLVVREILPDTDSACEEMHTALFVTQTDEHKLVALSPEALPLPAYRRNYGNPRQYLSTSNYGQRHLRTQHINSRLRGFPTVGEQGRATVTGRATKWSYLSGSFLQYVPANGAHVEAEITHQVDSGIYSGRLTPQLGADLNEAHLLVPRGEHIGFIALGDLQDGVSVPINATTESFNDYIYTVYYQLFRASLLGFEAYFKNYVLVSAFETAGAPYRGYPPRGALCGTPDLSRHILDGHPVLVGWSPETEPRLQLGRGVETEGWMIQRIVLPRIAREAGPSVRQEAGP